MALPEVASDGGLEFRSAEQVEIDGLRIVDLQVDDPRFPGRIFSGTIESALKEIRQLDPEVSTNKKRLTETTPATSVLERRQAPVR